MFRDNILRTIFENPIVREELYYSTEISEIDNYDNEGPYGNYFIIKIQSVYSEVLWGYLLTL